MLKFFRNFFKSKIGIPVAIGFLALIAFAFASADVANTGMFGGVSAGERVAVVGDRRLTAGDLSTAVTNAFEQARQTNPTLTMTAFIAGGGMDQALGALIDRTALAEFGREHGLRAGQRLIDSEIVQIPAFRGADGQFSQEAYAAALRQRRMSDAAVREEFANALFAQQLLTPAGLGAAMPDSFVSRYAALLRERRSGAIAPIPAEAFMPGSGPSDAQLQAFYQANRDRFIRPERRVIRYARFGEEALGDLPAPTEAQIAERYRRDQAQYAAREDRAFTQLVVPTQAAAQAIVAEVRGGKSLETAAREKGLRTTPLGPLDRADLTTRTSDAVAEAAFRAASGTIAEPARGVLGWYVLQVDRVVTRPQRTLAQVRGEIAEALATEQRNAALADLTARIEEDFDSGKSLAEVARENRLTLTSTAPVTADGRVYQSPDQTVPPELVPVLRTAFEMDEGEPQLDQVVPGRVFIVFEAAQVTPSAVAPLREVREQAVQMWRLDQGAKAAQAAADRILARVAGGTSLAEAVRAENVQLPPVETLDINREEIARLGRVPPQLALFFSMAERTSKKIAEGDRGWYVVRVDEISTQEIAEDDPILVATSEQLTQSLADEYFQQFVAAARNDVGVERNEEAIEAVSTQLSGQGG